MSMSENVANAENFSIQKFLYAQKVKGCAKCEKVKPIIEFSKKKDKYTSICLSCTREYSRRWYLRNVDEHKENTRLRKLERKSAQKIVVPSEKIVEEKRTSKKKEKVTKDSQKLKRHGISQSVYDFMLARYEGKCWICLESAATCIDHDHSCCSGVNGCEKCVRGVLCGKCNFLLGNAKDDFSILLDAIHYLESASEKS